MFLKKETSEQKKREGEREKKIESTVRRCKKFRTCRLRMKQIQELLKREYKAPPQLREKIYQYDLSKVYTM